MSARADGTRAARADRAGRVAPLPVRPVVLATWVHAGLCALWFLWILTTATAPAGGGAWRLLPPLALALVTAVDAGLLVALVLDARRVARGAAALRRPQLAGIAGAALVVVAVQVAAVLAAAPIEPAP